MACLIHGQYTFDCDCDPYDEYEPWDDYDDEEDEERS